MNVVLRCIFQQHDLRLVVVAVILCVLSCVTALAMILRAQAAQTWRVRSLWLIAAGMVAGAGIWATHFVAMLAYDSGLPIAFDPGLTVLSVAVAMLLCTAAAALALSSLGPVAGGMLAGFAICAMHYIGMAAVEMPADPVWNANLVIASGLVGISFGGLSGYFAGRNASLVNHGLAVVFFALAIVGMHFTAMAAVRFLPDPTRTVEAVVLAPEVLAIVVTACAAFIILQSLVVVVLDRYLDKRAQKEMQRQRAYIAELEAIKAALENTSADLTLALEAAEAGSKSKSAFLASMSHELRTPLNAVLGFSEMMQAEACGPVSPRHKEYLGNIHDSGAHLLSLINDILDIARFDSGSGELSEEVFDPARKIEDTVHIMSAQAMKAKVELVTDIASDLPYVNGDRRRMRQILLNLLSNALKFTPAGGTVTVGAHCVSKGLMIQVSDTGIGIARQDFAKALEPFGQIDSSLARKYQGTGLGLPLTRQLVEMHGGELTLESTPGRGTSVTIILPAWRLVARNELAA
jgi:signal transduction histidine kinase